MGIRFQTRYDVVYATVGITDMHIVKLPGKLTNQLFYKWVGDPLTKPQSQTFDEWMFETYKIQIIWDPGMNTSKWGFESEEALTAFLLQWS